MNKFSSYIVLLLIAMATLITSCSEDEVRASLTLSQSSVYFSELGEQTTITYTGSDIVEISFDEDDLPSGWEIYVSRGNQTMTIVGPTTEEDFEESLTSTTITFTVTSYDDLNSYDYLTLGTTNNSNVDLSASQANSFMVSQANTIYSFDATVKGEDGGTITPSSVSILWQTYPRPLSYSRLEDDKVVFHVAFDEDDYDEDGLTDDLFEGNAIIAAYNSSGTILWSWHIWVSDFSAEDSAVTLNGKSIMSRNLGACNNSTVSETTILESYGLYYQWGRKDPFVRPAYYNAAGSSDATMYDETGSAVTISYEESTSSVGKESYAIKYPLTFILGVEDSSYDWLYSAHSNELWSETKSVNDPCPKGWRVATPEVFDGLSIPALTQAEHDAIADSYGWILSDNAGNQNLFMGLGRRGYITGKIQNVNLNETRPTPWAGYYWSCAADDTTDNSANALYFAYDKTDPASNTISNKTLYRSNGMQVRCQRDE
ncbi:MAG: hypothetical protein SNF93_07360 [Rikenellaceae bacterium]